MSPDPGGHKHDAFVAQETWRADAEAIDRLREAGEDHAADVAAATREELDLAARDVVRLTAHLAELNNELVDLKAALAEREQFLVQMAGPGWAGDGGEAFVRVTDAQPGNRRVDPAACERHREALLDLGLGHLAEPVYIPPSRIGEIEASEARLLARGINPADLIGRFPPREPRVVVVPKEGEDR